MADWKAWKARLDHNALWVSLGIIGLAVGVVAVGVQVAPEIFWDQFVWKDIWGPLVLDAHQCRTSVDCPGVEGPPGVRAFDGYTPTSELVYGVTLAILLYGIYVGLIRRFAIVVDGHFILALMPWILLGPVARALEDANVFCQAGTDCTPGVFAYVFISPVIYMHIALYVIGALLLGAFLQRRRGADPRKLTGIVAAVLAMGVAAFGLVRADYAHGFHALPPLWVIALTVIAGIALFHRRAEKGLASVNLTVFVTGLPFAVGSIWLVGSWLAQATRTGSVWAPSAWNGEIHHDAAIAILGFASIVALGVYLLSRFLVKSGAESRWAAAAERLPQRIDNPLGIGSLAAFFLALLLAGSIPRLSAISAGIPGRDLLVPVLALTGGVMLVAYVFLHVGREAAARPGVLFIFAAGINIALVMGHMIDGLATWIALGDPFNFGLPQYAEKHPFSEILLRFWDGFLFPVTKLVMVLVIVWLLDREFRTEPTPAATPSADAQQDAATPDDDVLAPAATPPAAEGARNVADERNLVGLVKMAIFVLGFAPGLRDLLRVWMGV